MSYYMGNKKATCSICHATQTMVALFRAEDGTATAICTECAVAATWALDGIMTPYTEEQVAGMLKA